PSPARPGARPRRLCLSRTRAAKGSPFRSRRVSGATRKQARRQPRIQVETRDWQNRKGDSAFACFSCLLSCRAASRYLYFQQARQGSENKVRDSSTSLGMTRTSSGRRSALKLVCVWELPQNRVMPGRAKIFDEEI